MGYLDPRTGQWMNDDGTVAPGGMIDQQQASNSPPLVPPPPDPNAPPEPLYLGPQGQPGIPAPGVPGQDGANAAPILEGGPAPWQDPWAPPPEPEPGTQPGGPGIQIGEPSPLKFGAEMVPEPMPQEPGAPPVGELPPGPEAQVGEPSAPKFGADMVPPGADLPTGAPLPPDSGTPPTGSLPNLQLPEPTLGAAAPAGPDLGVPNLTPPDVGGIAPPADLKLSEPMADTVTPGSMPAPGELPAAAGAPAVPTKPEDLEAEAESNRKEQGALDIEKAKGNLAAANKIADLKAQAQKDAQKIIDQGQNDLAAARAQQKEDYDKYRAMGEKSVWGDNPTRNMILTGIAMIVGARVGLGFKMSSFVVLNAVNGLEQKKQADIAMQAKLLEHDGKNVDQIQEATAKKLADWQVQKAAGLDATVSRAEAEMAARGIPQATIDANKDIIALRSAAETAKEKADLAAHKISEDKIKDDLNTRKAQAEIDLMNARAAALAKKTKGGGAGSGGNSIDKKAVEWTNAVQQGVPDPSAEGGRRPMTTGEKQDLAVNLGIPLEGKAGQVTYSKLVKDVEFDANASRKANSGTDSTSKAVNARMDKYQQEAVGNPRSPGPVKALTQIEEMRQTLDDAVKTGDSDRIKAAVIKAKEQAGTIMSGGKLTNAQIKIMHDLESTADGLTASIGKFTGNPTEGAGAVRRLRMIINDAGSETSQQVSTLRERAMNEHLGPGGLANTPEAKRTFLNRANGLFSGAEWNGKRLFSEGQAAEARSAKPAAAPAPNVVPIRTVNDLLLRKQALATNPGDPHYDTAQQWLRLHGVIQ